MNKIEIPIPRRCGDGEDTQLGQILVITAYSIKSKLRAAHTNFSGLGDANLAALRASGDVGWNSAGNFLHGWFVQIPQGHLLDFKFLEFLHVDLLWVAEFSFKADFGVAP